MCTNKISFLELSNLIKDDDIPYYILLCGSVGAGKNFILNKYLPNIDTVDVDDYTMILGNGIYDSKYVAKALHISKQEVDNKLKSQHTFIHQGTSANLQSTINKLNKANAYGFQTVLIYINTTFDKARYNINNRVLMGGRGDTITDDKIKKSIKYSEFTFNYLTNTPQYINNDIFLRILSKIKNKSINLDYYIKYDNL